MACYPRNVPMATRSRRIVVARERRATGNDHGGSAEPEIEIEPEIGTETEIEIEIGTETETETEIEGLRDAR